MFVHEKHRQTCYSAERESYRHNTAAAAAAATESCDTLTMIATDRGERQGCNDTDSELTAGGYHPNSVISVIDNCIQKLGMIQRMLSKDYDFSSLTHPQTVNLTTLETLCYRGLLAYHQVVLDQIIQLQQSLNDSK